METLNGQAYTNVGKLWIFIGFQVIFSYLLGTINSFLSDTRHFTSLFSLFSLFLAFFLFLLTPLFLSLSVTHSVTLSVTFPLYLYLTHYLPPSLCYYYSLFLFSGYCSSLKCSSVHRCLTCHSSWPFRRRERSTSLARSSTGRRTKRTAT